MNQLSRTQHNFLLAAYLLSTCDCQPFTKSTLMRASSLNNWSSYYGRSLSGLLDGGYLLQQWRESKSCAYYQITHKGVEYVHTCFTS